MKTLLAVISVLLLCLVSLALEYHALKMDFVYLDNHLITNKPGFFNSPTRVSEAFKTNYFAHEPQDHTYRPLSTLSFILDYSIWKLNARGYHLTNILLNLLCIVMVFFILRMLFRKTLPAFWGAMLFAVFPVNLTAVTWIAGRSILLMAFFALASMLFYIYARKLNEILYYGLSLFFFALAMLSNEVSLILPFLFILYDLCFPQNAHDSKIPRTYYLFSALIVLGYLLVKGIFTGFQIGTFIFLNGKFIPNLLTVLKNIIILFSRTIFPLKPSFIYTIEPIRSIIHPWAILALGFIALVVIATVILRKKASALLFGLFWILMALLPVSNILKIPHGTAEYFLYLPSLGTIFIFTWLLSMLLDKCNKNLLKVLLSVVVIVLCFASSVIYHNNARHFRTNKVFLMQLNKVNPRYAPGFLYRAGETSKRTEKLHYINKALELDSTYAKAYNALGSVYYDEHYFELAEEYYRKALRHEPKLAEALYNMGNVRFKMGEYRAAHMYYLESLLLDKYNLKVYNTIALGLSRVGNIDMAVTIWEKALEYNPLDIDCNYNLAIAYFSVRFYEEAEKHFKVVLQQDPKNFMIYANLGALYENVNDINSAINAYRSFLKYASDHHLAPQVEEHLKKLTEQNELIESTRSQ
ncbi:tetratricopeptide repeat protein [bacterium]|nr:tetratricopeptide repeat protein [bacterium]